MHFFSGLGHGEGVEGGLGLDVHGEPSERVLEEVVVDVGHLGLREAPDAPVEVRRERELVGLHVGTLQLQLRRLTLEERLQVSVQERTALVGQHCGRVVSSRGMACVWRTG